MIDVPSITPNTIFDFEKIIGREVLSHIQNFDLFMSVHYTNLLEYYSGEDDLLNSETITSLEKLHKDSIEIEDKLVETYENMSRFDLFNFLIYIQDIQTQITYLKNIGKFLRSSKYDSFFENSVAVEYTTADGDTLEKISRRRSLNFNDDWIDIAVKNDLEETSYNAQEGGKVINVGKRNNQNQFLISVVDYLYGDRVYGLDIDAEISFVDNDFSVLSYRETFVQSVKILSELTKGDLPRYPDLGVGGDSAIGKTVGIFSLVFIEREMREVFGSDDTMIDFKVTNIERTGSKIEIEYTVRSFFDFVYNGSVKEKI